jgi:hypothetical protein
MQGARQMAQDSVANKKPLFFTGGIPQRMGWASDKMSVLATIAPDSPEYNISKQKSYLQQQELGKMEKMLEQEIIKTNNKPPNRYQGPDRPTLKQAVTAKWQAIYPADEIVGICIPSQEWKRTTEWRFQNSWYKVDHSWLQPQARRNNRTGPADGLCGQYLQGPHDE